MSTRTIHLFGWLMFLICAAAYFVSSWGNLWAMIGTAFFMAGCIVFLIPYFIETKDE